MNVRTANDSMNSTIGLESSILELLRYKRESVPGAELEIRIGSVVAGKWRNGLLPEQWLRIHENLQSYKGWKQISKSVTEYCMYEDGTRVNTKTNQAQKKSLVLQRHHMSCDSSMAVSINLSTEHECLQRTGQGEKIYRLVERQSFAYKDLFNFDMSISTERGRKVTLRFEFELEAQETDRQLEHIAISMNAKILDILEMLGAPRQTKYISF